MRGSGRMSRRAPAANATSLSCVAGVLAAAQASALTPADSSDIQEIIVTATRRSESVLDVRTTIQQSTYKISALRARRIFRALPTWYPGWSAQISGEQIMQGMSR